MGSGIKLTDAQRDELDHLRLRTPSADVYRNCLIILFSDSHDTIATIAGRLGCCTDTVQRIRRSYRQSGAAGSHPVKPPGRPAMRHYGKGSQRRRAGFTDWRNRLLQTVLSNPPLACVVTLQHEPALRSEEERVDQFVAATGYSRATYFRMKARLVAAKAFENEA
jgi:hypothetical protein